MTHARTGKFGHARLAKTDSGGSCMLTPDLQEKLIHLRSTKHLFDSEIAFRCGVSDRTLYRWISLGLDEDAKQPYKDFAQQYINAVIDQEDEVLEMVLKGHNGKNGSDWRAGSWWLERRHPTRWGNKFPDGAPGFDVRELLEANEQRHQTLNELLAEPPPELEAALIDNREAILAILGVQGPAALPEPSDPERS